MQKGFSGVLILVGVLIIAAVVGGAYFLGIRIPAREYCGVFHPKPCASGYHCQVQGNTLDAGGICVKN